MKVNRSLSRIDDVFVASKPKEEGKTEAPEEEQEEEGESEC
jgi:hypothetical protein